MLTIDREFVTAGIKIR